jgi:ferric-dicitrate binding protein FerR (iron transport regulator)
MKKNTNIENDYFFADWMSGQMTDNELQNKISKTDFLAYQKLRKTFDIIEELDQPLDNTLIKIKEQLKPSKRAKVLPLFAKWSLSIAASLLLFFGVYSYFNNSDVLINSTYGEQKTIALLDGSEVILNAKSTLKYNTSDWKKNRTLFLEGEAYFKVKKGKKIHG